MKAHILAQSSAAPRPFFPATKKTALGMAKIPLRIDDQKEGFGVVFRGRRYSVLSAVLIGHSRDRGNVWRVVPGTCVCRIKESRDGHDWCVLEP